MKFPKDAKNYLVNLVAQFIGRVVSVGSQLLVFLYVARKLSVSDFGKFAYFLTFVNVLTIFANFGSGETSSKDLGKLPGAIRPKYWGNFLILRTAFNIITSFLGCIGAFLLRKDMQVELVIGALCVPFASTRVFDPVFQIYDKPLYSSIASGVYGVSYFILSMIALLLPKPSILKLAFAYLTANIIFLLLAYYLSSKLIKPVFSIDRDLLKRILKIATPMGIASLFTIINSRADTFMLAWLKNDRTVGLYNAAYKVVDITALGMVVLTNPLIPVFSKRASENREDFVRTSRTIIEFMIFLLPPIAVLTPTFSKTLITLLYGPQFIEAAKALNILVWVCVLICFSLFSVVLCLSIDLVHFGWWNAALAAGINITLNYLWIPEYGFVGSCWATLICEIILLGITVLYLAANLPNLFSGKFLFKYLIFLLVWLSINYWLSKNMAGYGEIAISLLIYLSGGMIVFHREIGSVLQKR